MLPLEGMQRCMRLAKEEELDVMLQKPKREVLDVAQGELFGCFTASSRPRSPMLLDRPCECLHPAGIFAQPSLLNAGTKCLYWKGDAQGILSLQGCKGS